MQFRHLFAMLVIGAALATVTMGISSMRYGAGDTSQALTECAAIERSNAEISVASSADRDAQCVAYRRRIDLLRTLTTSYCAPPLSAASTPLPIKDRELPFFQRIVAEQCQSGR